MSEFRLPRLKDSVSIVDKLFRPTMVFIRWWQSVVEKIELAINSLTDAVAAIAAAQAAADAANAAAATATTAAATAQGAADSATATASLSNSGTTGLTLTATDAGADVTVAVSAHTRVYGDGSTLAIAGPVNITALAYSTEYYVYYDDPTRADTTPTYQTTTSEATAAQVGDRHLVGRVMTPAALAAPTNGDTVRPPGVGSLEN